MNKKVTIIASVVAVILVAAMLVFVFVSNSDKSSIDIIGNWEIVNSRVEGGNYIVHSNEYISFTEDGAVYYKNGQKKESSYTIDENNILKLPELNKEYLVEFVSDDNLKIVPDKSKPEYHSNIIRYSGDSFITESFNIDLLKGKWNLVMKAGNFVAEEYIVIDDKLFSDYRGASGELFAQDEYVFDANNHLVLNKLGKHVTVHFGRDDLMYFVELDTGYVWEFHRTK